MLPAVTLAEYEEITSTVLAEGEFNQLYPLAKSIVADLIGYNEVVDGNLADYKAAVCFAICKMATYGINEPVSGFSIGSFSVNGNSSVTGADLARDVAISKLQATGLLWSGVK